MSAEVFETLVRMTVAGSAAIVVVLLLRRPLRRAFGALVAYAAWGLVPAAVAAMLLPAPARPLAVLAGIVRVAPLATVQSAAAADALDPRPLLLALWLGGTLLAAAWFVLQQRVYLRSLGTLSPREGSRIVQSDSESAGPALVGAWRPRIVLPADFDRRYDARERELILVHERVHFERGDAWINALVVALRSLNWFNPLLHYAAATFRFDQELACDAAVIARFPEARRQYADAMLKVQLAGQPRQELRLPVGCRWPSHRTLKERILMLKQSRPPRARRAAGFALVSAVTLAFAYTARASQSSRPPTVPADGRQVDATLRIDVDGKTGKPVRVVHPLGSGFEVADGAWRATFVANATAGGDIALDTTIRDGNGVVGSPSIVARRGEPFSVAVGDAGDGTFRVEGTLAFADAARVVPRKAAKPAAVEARYRAMKPPVYPAEAIKNRIEGEVYVRVAIGKDGSVRDARVDHARPESAAAALGEAAVAAVKSWTFDPTQSGGVAVESEVLVPIEFSLDEKGSSEEASPEPGVLDKIAIRGGVKG